MEFDLNTMDKQLDYFKKEVDESINALEKNFKDFTTHFIRLASTFWAGVRQSTPQIQVSEYIEEK
jgi:archaellum component FlaC